MHGIKAETMIIKKALLNGNFKILVKSKLIRFLLIFYKNNTQHDLNKIMKKNLYNIPLDKCVNDIEIYKHYNLSIEEIDYINNIVK